MHQMRRMGCWVLGARDLRSRMWAGEGWNLLRLWCCVVGLSCRLRVVVEGERSRLGRGWRRARGNIRLCRSSGGMGVGRLSGRRRKAKGFVSMASHEVGEVGEITYSTFSITYDQYKSIP
jgi:hypothetical protein